MKQSHTGMRAGLLFLGVLVIASAYLAVNRIYQVDEGQNIFTARILGIGASADYSNHAPLYLLGPLAHMARRAISSTSLFTQARLLFLCIFWLNIILIALNLTNSLRSRRGLIALLAAASLTPLWDYGFEIRHDNLLLTGLLAAWWMVRREGIQGAWAMAGIGFLTVLLQFTAFKSFLFFLPLSAALLFFPPPGWRGRRLLHLTGWVGGILLGFALARSVYDASGTWEVYLTSLKQQFVLSPQVVRFPPWNTLLRLTRQSPMVTGLALGALVAWVLTACKDKRAALTWSGPLPELLLAMGVLGVFLINPTPFPYNLLLVVPFLLLTLRARLPELEAALEQNHVAFPWLVAMIVMVHGLPFITNTVRHFQWGNDRQERLMNLAEKLTDPTTDPVYDGVGMVPTRASIGFHWYLHSLNMKDFESGKWPSLRTMLERRAAPVLLVSYRMDWLPKEDKEYIGAHYLPLADDFWVLGGKLPSSGGEWICIHSGRYLFALGGKMMGRTDGLRVDGKDVGTAPVEMKAGSHRIETSPGTEVWVAWIGPHETNLPHLTPSDHQRLFVNWY